MRQVICNAGLSIRIDNPLHLLRLSMFDGPMMLWMNWPAVDTIHHKVTFATGVNIKATVELKLHDNSAILSFSLVGYF